MAAPPVPPEIQPPDSGRDNEAAEGDPGRHQLRHSSPTRGEIYSG